MSATIALSCRLWSLTGRSQAGIQLTGSIASLIARYGLMTIGVSGLIKR
jgi:hypothetical protein